jgi:hypothetical protein
LRKGGPNIQTGMAALNCIDVDKSGFAGHFQILQSFFEH